MCGKISHVSSAALKNGKSRSCGCKQKESVGKRIIDSNFKNLRYKLYKNCERAALRRNYCFNLSFKKFSELIAGNCYYCGLEPEMSYSWYGRGKNQATDYTQFKYSGVDRINNFNGYTVKNCVSCCKICNNSKSTLSTEEWFKWLQRLAKHQKKLS